MGNSDRRIEEPQVIVNFRDRADGTAGTAAGGFLIDGNGWAEPVDRIDVGTLHLVQELAGVGGEGFDVPPLTFRIDRVERQRRLSGAAQTGNDRQAVARNANADIF